MPRMPNTDYAFRGYNYFIGDPFEEGVAGDPGFRGQIFKAVYSTNNEDHMSSDFLYRTPKGLRVYGKTICTFDYESKTIASGKEYRRNSGVRLILSSLTRAI